MITFFVIDDSRNDAVLLRRRTFSQGVYILGHIHRGSQEELYIFPVHLLFPFPFIVRL